MLGGAGAAAAAEPALPSGPLAASNCNRVDRCIMTDGPQDGAAPAAAAQAAEQQQQEQQVAAQVEQLTYSLQDLLKKPEAE